jgi:hypothetical protein
VFVTPPVLEVVPAAVVPPFAFEVPPMPTTFAPPWPLAGVLPPAPWAVAPPECGVPFVVWFVPSAPALQANAKNGMTVAKKRDWVPLSI